MGYVSSSNKYTYLSLKSKHDGKLNPGVYDNMTKEKMDDGYQGELVAMRPDTYEWNGETKHKLVLVIDGSDAKDRSEMVKLEVPYNSMYRNIINSLSTVAQDKKNFFAGSTILLRAYAKGEYGNVYIEVDGEKCDWKLTPDQFKTMIDSPVKWEKMFDKFIKPYIPADYQPEEPALAGSTTENAPNQDDDDLPF